MAINIIQPKATYTGSKGREGGGKTGQMMGAALGAAIAGGAAVASGGAALPIAAAALGGAGGGAGLGAMVGGAVDKGKADTRQAIQRRAEGIAPSQQSGPNPQEHMKQAISALRQSNDPALIKEYAPVLAQGLVKSSLG